MAGSQVAKHARLGTTLIYLWVNGRTKPVVVFLSSRAQGCSPTLLKAAMPAHIKIIV